MKGKSNNRLLTNVLSYAVLQVVNMLVGLFLPRLYLATYGSEVNGIISTINSFTTYFSYLEAGLGLTLIHSLFKPLSDDDVDSTNAILSYSKRQYRKISCLYFALVIALSLVFPLVRITNDIGRLEFSLLVLVIGAYGAFDFYSMAKYRVLLTADRKEYVISYAMILAQILRFVFVWIFLNFDFSVVFVKIVPIFTLFVRSLILKIYIRKKYPKFSFSEEPSRCVSLSRNRWDALLLQISISTSMAFPTILVAQFLGYKEANVFGVYSLVISAVISIVSALSSGVSPMLGRIIARGKSINDIYDAYDYIVSIVLAITFSVATVMMLPFVMLYTSVVDDINYVVPLYAVLFSVWGALYSYRIPITAVTNAAGIYRQNRIHNITNLAIQVVGGIVATLIWGVPGLLVTMIVAALHRNIALTLVNSKELLHNGIVKCIYRQAIISVIVLMSFVLLSPLVIDRASVGVISWIILAALVFLALAAVCFVIMALADLGATKKIIKLIKNKLANIFAKS